MISTEKRYLYYRITPRDDIVLFEKINEQEMYQPSSQGTFTRKTVSFKPIVQARSSPYNDPQFPMPVQSQQYELVRLYRLYNKQILLFPQDQQSSSYIGKQNAYNSFMAQSGLISYEYLRTLFLTQKINKQGFYKYFIKKDGQYFQQDCDDIIPINKKTKRPLWDLNVNHPWQLILLKAWIKHCGSLNNLYKTDPFEFIEAFGLTQYKVYNFRKQLHFILNQRINQQYRKENQRSLAINKNDVIILGKTISDPIVEKVGLIPNFAAYRILRISKPNEASLYRVYSTLPCFWAGSYTPITNTKLNSVFNRQMYLDLERNFIMTQKQLINYFNKFYVVPFELSLSQRIFSQDCISVYVSHGKPVWLRFQVKSGPDMLAICIQLPKSSMKSRKYPQFRYFLSKYTNHESANNLNYRNSSPLNQPQAKHSTYIESQCQKWQYYMVDYMQGYNNKGTFFCRVVEGVYILYINADYTGTINVRFDAYTQISRPQVYRPTAVEMKQIFESTFYSVSREMNIQVSVNSNKFQQSIIVNNSFEELGYGSIAIRSEMNARHKIAMRIFPNKLKQAGIKLLDFYYQYYTQGQSKRTSTNNGHGESTGNGMQPSLVLISYLGKSEIVVMQKIENRSDNTIGTVFPPPGAVQFFKLTPFLNYN